MHALPDGIVGCDLDNHLLRIASPNDSKSFATIMNAPGPPIT